MKEVLLALLVCLSAILGAQGQVDLNTQRMLRDVCNVTQIPKPGSDGDFIGPMLRLNTTRTEYTYWRFGNTQSARPPLVMVLGFASSIMRWGTQLLETLAQDQEVIIFDHNGQGLSRDLAPRLPVSIESITADVMDFIAKLQLQRRPNILGWSMGGMVATALAAQYGQRLNNVIVVAGAAGSPNSVSPATSMLDFVSSSNSSSLLAGSVLFSTDTAAGVQAWCDYQIDTIVAKQSPINTGATLKQTRAILQFFRDSTVWKLLPTISNRMLLVGGADDALVSSDNLKIMVPWIKSVQLAIYPNAKHAVLFQRLNSFLRLVDGFLKAGVQQ